MDNDAIVCSRLALDRCQSYVSQIQAVIYLCSDDNDNLGRTASRTLQRIAAMLGSEIEASASMLVLPDDPPRPANMEK